jgi:hypothetical protein
MHKRIFIGALSLLLLFSFTYSQAAPEKGKLLLQEKRPEVVEGNTRYLAVFVHDTGDEQRNKDWRIIRMQVEVSPEIYNRLVQGESYQYEELKAMGVALKAEKEEDPTSEGEKKKELIPSVKAYTELNLAEMYKGTVEAAKSIIPDAASGKKVSYNDVKALWEGHVIPFVKEKNRAKDEGLLDLNKVESDSINFEVMQELAEALNSYFDTDWLNTSRDRQGSLRKALGKISSGLVVKGVKTRKDWGGRWLLFTLSLILTCLIAIPLGTWFEDLFNTSTEMGPFFLAWLILSAISFIIIMYVI